MPPTSRDLLRHQIKINNSYFSHSAFISATIIAVVEAAIPLCVQIPVSAMEIAQSAPSQMRTRRRV